MKIEHAKKQRFQSLMNQGKARLLALMRVRAGNTRVSIPYESGKSALITNQYAANAITIVSIPYESGKSALTKNQNNKNNEKYSFNPL